MNEFLLPNELGWECNDELSDLLERWHTDWFTQRQLGKFEAPTWAQWKVHKATLIDEMYAVIKKYQEKK